MKVKWTEFDKLGYECSAKVYRAETKMDDFFLPHEGEVVNIFVVHNEPWLLVLEGNKLVTAKATDCEVIVD